VFERKSLYLVSLVQVESDYRVPCGRESDPGSLINC